MGWEEFLDIMRALGVIVAILGVVWFTSKVLD